MSETNTASADQAQVTLPYDAYRLRCIECTRGKSGKGDANLTQEFEVFGHSNPLFNGVKIKNWSTLTEKAMFFVNAQREALGLPLVKSDQLSSVDPLDYKGTDGAATCKSETEEQKNDVTGEPVINPNTGKPMLKTQRRIVSWCPRN